MAEFVRVFNLQGFDRFHTPRWQMVPAAGRRYTLLRDGAGLTVISQDPRVLTVAEVRAADLPVGAHEQIRAGDRLFLLEGRAKGQTSVRALRHGVVEVELDVDTKNQRDLQLTFNFVRDSAGHRTRRVPAAAAEWVRVINAVYNGQANIFFTHTTRWVKAEQNLRNVVRFSAHLAGVAAAQHEWDVVTALGDMAADMNFFLVREYEQDATPYIDLADGGTIRDNCLFEDHAGSQVGESMAHEVGHFLGGTDHMILARQRELMYGITDQRGTHLPKADVNIMNQA
jgi:hypothetical protein